MMAKVIFVLIYYDYNLTFTSIETQALSLVYAALHFLFYSIWPLK